MASDKVTIKIAEYALHAVLIARRNRLPNTKIPLSWLLDKLPDRLEFQAAKHTFGERSCQDVVKVVTSDPTVQNLSGHYSNKEFYFSWPDAEGTPTR